jgi:hypothetical protein
VVNGGYRAGRGKVALTKIFDHGYAPMPRRVNLKEGERYMGMTNDNRAYVVSAMAIPSKYPAALAADDSLLWQQLNLAEGSDHVDHLLGAWPLHQRMDAVVAKIGDKLSADTAAIFSGQPIVDKNGHELYRDTFNSYTASLHEAAPQPSRYGSFAAGGKPLPALKSSKEVAQPAAEGEAPTAADKLPADTKPWVTADAARRYARRLLADTKGGGVTDSSMSSILAKMYASRKRSAVTEDGGVLGAMYDMFVRAIGAKMVAMPELHDTYWSTLIKAVEARKPPKETKGGETEGGESPPEKKRRKAPPRKSGGTTKKAKKAAGKKRDTTWEDDDEAEAVEEVAQEGDEDDDDEEDEEEDDEVSVSAAAPMSSVRLTQAVKDAVTASVRAAFSDMPLNDGATSGQMAAALAAIGDVGTKLAKFEGEWSAASELYVTQQKLAQATLDLKQTESDMAKIMVFAGAMVGSASPEEARHTISAMRTLAAVYPEMRSASVIQWRRIATTQAQHPDIALASKPLPAFEEHE